MKMRTLVMAALAVGAVGFAAVPAVRAGDERIGTSVADAASFSGKFVVHNPTNAAIPYSVKWGDKGTWQKYTLEPKHNRWHAFPLDARDRAPIPYVKFDNYGGDGRVTLTTEQVQFGRVGYRGYTTGPSHIDESIHYEFRYAADRRSISLNRR